MGAAKFSMLLTTPLPLLHPRPSLLTLASRSALPHILFSLRRRRTLSPSSPGLGLRIGASRRSLHVQSAIRDDRFGEPNGLSHAPRAPHPWPEWSRLIDALASCGYFDHQRFVLGDEDEFVSGVTYSEEFVRDSHSCLAFAHDRPDLLRLLSRKEIEVVIENGNPFLFKNAVGSTRRMKSFLGGGESNVLEREVAHTVDLVRYLLSYLSNPAVLLESNAVYDKALVESSVRLLLSELTQLIHSAQEPYYSASAAKQLPGQYGQTSRPVGQNIEMKRGDWICPRCNFMNFARNVKCLECEEARPKRQLSGGEWECPQCDFYNYSRNVVCLRCDCKRPGEVSFSNNSVMNNVGIRFTPNEEKEERWFQKVSSQDSSPDMNGAIADEDFPEIMPLRKGVNRFVVSTRKTPLEWRLANSQDQSNLGHDGTSEGNNAQYVHKNLDGTVSSRLDEILGRTRNSPPVPGPSSQQSGPPKGTNSNYVPFVPLPADMFAKKSQDSKTQESGSNGYGKSGDFLPSKTQENQKEQGEKSERWFQRVAELHDGRDLGSEIPDKDFPEVMPMPKGDNRFVVSKKRDHALTSPPSKRRLQPDQESAPKFVPFPPDYFAKKDKPLTDETDSGKRLSCENSITPEKLTQNMDAVNPRVFNMRPSEGNLDQRTLNQNSNNPQSNDRNGMAHFGKERTTENPNIREKWAGKSLEGSAVTEPDPLDMSEEAKTQRWFQRVAHIKDISELSQIPDEDFPSIMPIRKGVNRFVVSKRKTPLERRLTSAQYRRNLPVVSSEPVKEEDEGS